MADDNKRVCSGCKHFVWGRDSINRKSRTKQGSCGWHVEKWSLKYISQWREDPPYVCPMRSIYPTTDATKCQCYEAVQ
jgi:hypothetical protein